MLPVLLKAFSMFCSLGGPWLGPFIVPLINPLCWSVLVLCVFLPIFLTKESVLNSDVDAEGNMKKNGGKAFGVAFGIWYGILLVCGCCVMQSACKANDSFNPYAGGVPMPGLGNVGRFAGMLRR